MNAGLFWSLLIVFAVFHNDEVEGDEGWRREQRQRRRRRCHATNCSLSPWSSWSSCSMPCGTRGIQERKRHVTKNAWCGGSCRYAMEEKRPCNRGCSNGGTPISGSCLCKPGYRGKCCNEVDGGWDVWTRWSPCDKSCGGGHQEHRRSCTKPPPSHGGKNCVGADQQIKTCNLQCCPVNGHWSNWGSWSTCDTSCGQGRKERHRTCTNPPQACGGRDCGPFLPRQSARCSQSSCPIVYFGVGCYGRFPDSFPDLLKDFGWSAYTSTQPYEDEIKNIVHNCAKLAKSKGLHFFAVENHARCSGNLKQNYNFGEQKREGCRVFGHISVGLRHFYYVYKVL